MKEKEIAVAQFFSKTISIQAPSLEVWKMLTDIEIMKKWMSDEEISIITDWKVGNPIIIKGNLHWVYFENRGEVLACVPGKILRYNHLSSLSKLKDEPKSYSIFEFSLREIENQTALTLTLSNFPTESIYKHLAFYWNITLELLKKMIEEQHITIMNS